jgi:CubicO group peptidase (beta-lactamase class C family)
LHDILPFFLSFFSNLGYAILAHALFEKFGGRYGSWQQWMLHEVLYPLGMTRTVLNNNRYLNLASLKFVLLMNY